MSSQGSQPVVARDIVVRGVEIQPWPRALGKPAVAPADLDMADNGRGVAGGLLGYTGLILGRSQNRRLPRAIPLDRLRVINR